MVHTEYIAIYDASADIFLANLINEILDIPHIYPIPLYKDNAACITISEEALDLIMLKNYN